MKATGIVRHIDDLGRIVLPKELRQTYDIREGDPLEVFVTDKGIMLRKYAPGCLHCGSKVKLYLLEGKKICLECRIKICRTLVR
ncbi:MAG: AbrB/MazE/SpoVT family DNA-binding domain-containing protein [Candidatus Pristimantibacillus lignocellulolyticus]|uniref:AbrB/MazE/SpoVT family DNA-binding domain-containing protein n=1 Tax=Candidatus Pristimantibacillus lignocellulolyticus TaxID=2994561 RepID=A0A9J6ZFV0_9BACL|nr:MAG: AbrB/MazE/SpoVT family DNA-binding domain-containing protein [Candidatus Pristimantibacillus lignocellulolyticus]